MTGSMLDEIPVPGQDDPAALLADVRDYLAGYVAFPSQHELVAATLWVAHAHAAGAFESTPRLAALSPEPGSGKTRLLECLEVLTPRPMHVLSASPAAIFRSIETERPTLLLDEVDAVFGRKGKDDSAEDLRGLLNAGHRAGATIPRCVGKSFEVKRFPVYCAVALAGLGDLPDTLMSRSIVLRMRRRAPSEHVSPFRHREAEAGAAPIRDALTQWAAEHLDALADARPVMPAGVHDRAADVWEALLAVADEVGGEWPLLAREACIALVKVVENREASLGVRLLADLRTVFGDAIAMHTETIIDKLCDLDEAPWGDLYGKRVEPRRIARILGGYGVSSTKVNVAGRSLQGYRHDDLWDSWQRYLSPSQSAEPAEPAETRRSHDQSTALANGTRMEPQKPERNLSSMNHAGKSARSARSGPAEINTNGVGSGWVCVSCSLALDPVLVTEGAYTHPACDREAMAS